MNADQEHIREWYDRDEVERPPRWLKGDQSAERKEGMAEPRPKNP